MNSPATFTVIAATAWLAASAVGADVAELTIEAHIDGPSALHIRANSIFWENGENAKPGKANMLNEPTYVNGAAWMPHWKDEKHDRGKDKSSLNSVSLGTTDLQFELISVTKQRGETGIEQRTPIVATQQGSEFIISIPDPETGQRWYKFVVKKKKKGA